VAHALANTKLLAGSVALADVRIATHDGYFMRQTPFSLLALPSFLGAPKNAKKNYFAPNHFAKKIRG
jgi:hypothetical protein